MTMRTPQLRLSSITPMALIAAAGRAALVQRPARAPHSPSATARRLSVAEAPPDFAGWQSWRCGRTIASADCPATPPGCPTHATASPLRRWPSATRSPSSAVAVRSNSRPRWSCSRQWAAPLLHQRWGRRASLFTARDRSRGRRSPRTTVSAEDKRSRNTAQHLAPGAATAQPQPS